MSAMLDFGVLLGPSALGMPDPVSLAARAESLGFERFLVPDHFNEIPSPIPTLGAVAAATELGIGTYMLANDLRHPAQTARDIATLDVLSGGRAILGIGAGWMPADYLAIGRELDSFSARLDRLEEAVDLIRAVWKGDACQGEHYSSDPGQTIRPIQVPGPPIIIGGGGPRMIAAAARLADVVSIGVPLSRGDRAGLLEAVASATFDGFGAQISVAREHGASRIDTLLFGVANDPASIVRDFSVTRDQLETSPYLYAGTDEQIAHGFARLAQAGVDSVVVRAADIEVVASARAHLEELT